MASDEQVATAIKAAIVEQMRTGIDVLDHDEHQGLNAAHIQYGQARRPLATYRAGRESKSAFRITTRVVDDSVSNVRATQRRVDLALHGKRVLIDGAPTGVIVRETQDEPQLDEGMFSALTTYTFTH